jgi:hypothetical protein
MRYRILGTALTVWADEDNEEMEYVFRYDGSIWTIGMEDVEL